MFQKEISSLKIWLSRNKLALITIFFIYQIAIVSIGIVNYPYIDDISRQLNGKTGFATHFSRVVSEGASWIVQGSRHLTDMGLTTHILTGLILALASVIALKCLTDKITIIKAIVSTIIGLNPWFLQCISFRFDSPYMALSVLFSFLPFLWWKKNNYLFLGISFISLLLMCNTYQSSSGIYIIMILALSLKDLLAGKKLTKVFWQILFSGVAYILAILAYAFETTFNSQLAARGNIVKTASIKNIPSTFISNTRMYLKYIFNQSTKMWILLFFILLCLFIVTAILNSKIPSLKSTIYSIVYIILASIFSYGVYLIFVEQLAEAQPRYAYGFSVFVAITIILLLDNITISFIKIPTLILTCLFSYYILTFPFIYASALHYQISSFETQSVMFATELKDLVDDSTTNIYANRLFKNSPVYDNISRNYQILHKLVPDNSSLYWPNQWLFSTITGLSVNINSFNPTEQNLSNDNLEVDNYYYKIYKQDNNLYIIMKQATPKKLNQ